MFPLKIQGLVKHRAEGHAALCFYLRGVHRFTTTDLHKAHVTDGRRASGSRYLASCDTNLGT